MLSQQLWSSVIFSNFGFFYRLKTQLGFWAFKILDPSCTRGVNQAKLNKSLHWALYFIFENNNASHFVFPAAHPPNPRKGERYIYKPVSVCIPGQVCSWPKYEKTVDSKFSRFGPPQKTFLWIWSKSDKTGGAEFIRFKPSQENFP